MSRPLRVCVTGAAGQIAYSLLPHICLGRTFGQSQRIILHLLDIERALPVSFLDSCDDLVDAVIVDFLRVKSVPWGILHYLAMKGHL
jgi:hypothetical protein